MSPDGQFVVILGRGPDADEESNCRILYVHDIRAGHTRTIKIPNMAVDHVGWLNEGVGLRAVLASGENGAQLQHYLADPATGKYVPVDLQGLATHEPGKVTSPDGARVAELQGKAKLVISDKEALGERVFDFHEDDVRHMGEEPYEWVSSRYLKFTVPRLAFLDVETMKLSYPIAKSKESTEYTFSPDFHWVLWHRAEEGLFLGKIVDAEDNP